MKKAPLESGAVGKCGTLMNKATLAATYRHV